MSAEPSKAFPVSWDQFHRDSRALAWRLSGEKGLRAIVCITRGGLVPAAIVARELGVNFRSTSGPVIAKAGDLAAQLTNLEERDVLFIDEIHRLNPAVEEILYPAMEDFQLDLIIGEGPAARSVKSAYRPKEECGEARSAAFSAS